MGLSEQLHEKFGIVVEQAATGSGSLIITSSKLYRQNRPEHTPSPYRLSHFVDLAQEQKFSDGKPYVPNDSDYQRILGNLQFDARKSWVMIKDGNTMRPVTVAELAL